MAEKAQAARPPSPKNPGSKPKLEVSQCQLLAALRSYEDFGGAKLAEIVGTVAPALDLGGGGAFLQRQRFAELYDLPALERRLRKIADEDPDGLWIVKATATRSPNPSSRQVRKALRAAGCEEIRQKGSHVQVRCPPEGRQTTVPAHGSKDIKKGTIRSIERSVGIDVDGDGRPVTPRARRLASKLSNP